MPKTTFAHTAAVSWRCQVARERARGRWHCDQPRRCCRFSSTFPLGPTLGKRQRARHYPRPVRQTAGQRQVPTSSSEPRLLPPGPLEVLSPSFGSDVRLRQEKLVFLASIERLKQMSEKQSSWSAAQGPAPAKSVTYEADRRGRHPRDQVTSTPSGPSNGGRRKGNTARDRLLGDAFQTERGTRHCKTCPGDERQSPALMCHWYCCCRRRRRCG